MAQSFGVWTLSLLILLAACCAASPSSECSCGYRDESAGVLFTESIIAYFNETGIDAGDFIEQSYVNTAEKSWNAVYRQGASPQNVVEDNGTDGSASLQLWVNPPTEDHIVIGAGIRTKRQDILYGTFRALLRSPHPRAGGSALTMSVEVSETESININLMNTDNASTAWISTLLHDEFPSPSLGVQYQAILAAAATNSSVQSPWDFLEVRADWTEDKVDYYIGGNLTRSVLGPRDLPQTPCPFYLRHWSTGNKYTSQGPPTNRSTAQVGWVRLFFNSSLMTSEQHKAYDERCILTASCSIGDWQLRGSSQYEANALLPWQQVKPKPPKRIPAIVVSTLSVAISAFLIFHTILRRRPWKRRNNAPKSTHKSRHPAIPTGPPASPPDIANQQNCDSSSDIYAGTTPVYSAPSSHRSLASTRSLPVNGLSAKTTVLDLSLAGEGESSGNVLDLTVVANDGKTPDETPLKNVVLQEVPAPAVVNPPKKQIDYLAGLLAVCAIVVTAIHFGLTFIPALIEPYAAPHYISEVWARKTLAAFFLSFIWLGPFITTSARFLAATYLREGRLEDIARKAVERAPRLMIPVAAVTLIEYFLINSGATTWLEYLPSLTWSDWVYTSTYGNFAQWLSELLELTYLVPNAAPAMTFHYCTGVLWTIPVQLQFSWTVLLGAVVVREIRTPWKRFLYYAFAVVTHWYARSWGSFLWVGLLFADMDVSYDFKKGLSTRYWRHAVVLSLFIVLVLLGITADFVPEWIDYNFSIFENNIHPDPSSAFPLGDTENAGYPPYYVPRLSGLAFATGLQGIVEISVPVQKLLSTKFLIALFPHVLTIYLIHGLIFWSWGAWLMVTLNGNVGLPYWAALLIVAITSYTLIGLGLPILTPVLETLGRNLTRFIWQTAVTEPPTRRKTVFPFDKRLIVEYEWNEKT